jgi:cyclic pyranopterin phosphate synthase
VSDLTHVDEGGQARMVDVGGKPATVRVARASGTIRMAFATLQAIRSNQVAKGDVLTVARVAGIMAAKRTAELIPLCHPLPLDDVQVVLSFDDTLPGLRVETTARTTARTGVEMEAITAAAMTLITVYDMAKGIDKTMLIGEICLIEKSGGIGGDYRRQP